MNFPYLQTTAATHEVLPEVSQMEQQKPEYRVPRIFLATVNFELRSLLQRMLSQAGYDITSHTNGNDLRDAVTRSSFTTRDQRHGPYDLLVLDAELLDEQDLQRIQDLQRRDAFPPLILITAFSDDPTRTRMRALQTVAQFDMSRASFAYYQLATVLRVVPL